ncbi:MAG: phage tail family protein [Oscillospiraceae bacterium]|nr:phage tail family protein [Oscillospiraceae bacterium]
MIRPNQFEYNGKRSYDDFGLLIAETPPFVIAERDIEFTSVSGRSGDVLADNGRYNNVTKEYSVILTDDVFPLAQTVKKMSAWLTKSANYYKLCDTYEPNYYRLAAFSGNISVTDLLLQIGTATLTFNCKPYKYLLDGQKEITLTEEGSVYNPEDFDSVPYIKITGDGDITLMISNDNGNTSFYFEDVEEYIEIDGELMSAYKGNTLENSKISFVDFPTLAPGQNEISFVGDVESITIIPRWRSL